MNGEVLIAYASKHGSTAEIAEAIGRAIRETGLTADVRPARDIRDVSAYGRVVVGSAVYMNKWQGDAIDFLKRFEADLATRPTWLFSSGPTGGTPEAEPKVAEILAAQPDPPGEVATRAARIGVRGHVTFGGRTGDEMTGLLERWLPRGDWRDFDAIRAWARSVAEGATA
jgi:menaquinone-dependent protoporphyrinogen oxidase